MSCRYEEQVALWAGGDLTAEESAVVETHLKDCDGCRELAVALGSAVGLLREAGEEELPAGSLSRVRSRVRRDVAARKARWRLGAVAAVLLVGMSAALWNSRTIEVAGPPTLATVRNMIPGPASPAIRKTAPPPVAAVQVTSPPVEVAPTVLARVEKPEAVETMVVKLLTDDPDVVIYWIVEGTGD